MRIRLRHKILLAREIRLTNGVNTDENTERSANVNAELGMGNTSNDPNSMNQLNLPKNTNQLEAQDDSNTVVPETNSNNDKNVMTMDQSSSNMSLPAQSKTPSLISNPNRNNDLII